MIPAIAFRDDQQADMTTQPIGFKQQLEKVISKIAIAPDFTVTYPDYQPLEFAPYFQEYISNLSPQDRQRYLVAKLQPYLYKIFKDQHRQEATEPLEESKPTLVANYVNKWTETKFFQALNQNNYGQGYDDPDWLVIEQVGDLWRVSKNDLTLHIHPEYLSEVAKELSPGKLVSLRLPPNRVERGVYIGIGNQGSVNKLDCPQTNTINQLYFNVDSQGALGLLANLTQTINQAELPFDLKINYHEANFDDYEGVILEFLSRDSELIFSLVETAYIENQAYFRPEIPFFGKFMAPGIGFAEKPRSQGKVQLSKSSQKNVGHYYCRIIALALVEQWQSDSLAENKPDYVLNYLSKKGVNIEYFYLNQELTKE